MELFLLHVFCISSCLLPGSLGADSPATDQFVKLEPLKDRCPDDCIPVQECQDAGLNAQIRTYFPQGNGFCNFMTRSVQEAHCPIATEHECMMQCGGEKCSTRANIDKYGKEKAKYIKVYQRFGEPTLTYERYQKVVDRLEELRRLNKKEIIAGEEKIQEVIEKVDKE